MDISLQEACREARKRLGLTSQDLSDASGIPVSTINNFFANGSKRAALAIAGPLCCALHVSIDRIFGITEILPPDKKLAQTRRQHATELHAARMEGIVESLKARVKAQQTLIFIQSIVLALVISSLTLYVVLDYQATDEGLIQGRISSVVGWVMFLLLAACIGIFAAVFIMCLRYAKEHTPDLDE
jgi:transcriptional regulator with XRE-family HTH domain